MEAIGKRKAKADHEASRVNRQALRKRLRRSTGQYCFRIHKRFGVLGLVILFGLYYGRSIGATSRIENKG